MRLPEANRAGILVIVISEVGKSVPRDKGVAVIKMETNVLLSLLPVPGGRPRPHHVAAIPDIDHVRLPHVGRLANEDGVQNVTIMFQR